MRTEPVRDATAWRGADLAGDTSWWRSLSRDEVRELDNALRHVNRHNLKLREMSKDDFPLGGFATELHHLLDELELGRGFFLLRGFPVERYSQEDLSKIYWGIGLHLGTASPQNARGDLIGQVRDQGFAEFRDTSTIRGYQTRARLSFHTDHVDVVGLFCLQVAKEGGLSSIVSSTTIYNEILRNHRQYLGLLYEDFSYDHRGEQAPGESATYRSPIYSYYEDRVSCRTAALDYVFSAQEKTGVHLSKVELEAIELFQALAERDDLRLDMEFQPGDLQFLHNSVILHSRTAYVDYEEPERKRHLLRLWLNIPNNRRPLAPGVAVARRTGVFVSSQN